MKKILFFPVLILTSFFIVSSCNHKKKKQSHDENYADLFNGTHADQWRGFKNDSLPANWIMQDSSLVTLGHGSDMGGDIITKNTYEDFYLSFEWDINKGGNNGTFLPGLRDYWRPDLEIRAGNVDP